MNPFRTPEFLKLKEHWYEELKKSGFEDAEDTDSPNQFMKNWHGSYFQVKYDEKSFSAKRKYYELASSFLYKHQFPTDLHIKIWEMHSDGLSTRKISARLGVKTWVVHETIQGLREEMFKKP